MHSVCSGSLSHIRTVIYEQSGIASTRDRGSAHGKVEERPSGESFFSKLYEADLCGNCCFNEAEDLRKFFIFRPCCRCRLAGGYQVDYWWFETARHSAP